MTVMENLQFFCGLRLMTKDEIDTFAKERLAEVGLDSKKNSFVNTLSGG